MKLSEYRKLRPQKKSKYNSQKSGGYDSKKEHRRANELKMLLQYGTISELCEQVPYILAPAQYVESINGKMICVRRTFKYIADFVYIKDGKTIVEDSKGFKTKEYKHKKSLMLKLFGIEILES